jgi:hypothetical protein
MKPFSELTKQKVVPEFHSKQQTSLMRPQALQFKFQQHR